MLLPFLSYGQATNSLPLGVLPMEFNPSFAGGAGAARLNSAFGYSASKSNFGSGQGYDLFASYDQFVPSLRSGLALTVSRVSSSSVSYNPRAKGSFFKPSKEVVGEFFSEDYLISMAVAPKFSIKGKYTLSPSVDFSLQHGSFNSQAAPGHSLYVPESGSYMHLSSKLGLLFNTHKYYIGYSASIFGKTNLSWEETPNTYNPLLRQGIHPGYTWQTIQAGYTFQKNPESEFSFTPQLAFSLALGDEGTNLNLKFNLTARYKRYLAGLDGSMPFVGAHVGYQTDKWRLMLNQHITNIDEENAIPFSGNISFRYLFNKTDKAGPASW